MVQTTAAERALSDFIHWSVREYGGVEHLMEIEPEDDWVVGHRPGSRPIQLLPYDDGLIDDGQEELDRIEEIEDDYRRRCESPGFGYITDSDTDECWSPGRIRRALLGYDSDD